MQSFMDLQNIRRLIMLTGKQNLLETMHGGHPDRFVNTMESFGYIMSDPYNLKNPYPEYGETGLKSPWGYLQDWPEGFPGPFPRQKKEFLVCHDIENWKDQIKAPEYHFIDSDWEAALAEAEGIDRNEQFAMLFRCTGLFERCHYLMGMDEALLNLALYPDEMTDLIKYLTEWELKYAEDVCAHLHPDALYFQDDWGSRKSTFMSVPMFEEFFLDSYKEIYGYYKSHGVEVITHHTDTFAEPLVPSMIEMGIDIWEGCLPTNDISTMIKKYGGKITFEGGINNVVFDHDGWTEEEVAAEVRRACETYGTLYYIPDAITVHEGLYEEILKQVGIMSSEMF